MIAPPVSNEICPMTGDPYWRCQCDRHRCGDCGRRRSQWDESDSPGGIPRCQCYRNRLRNLGVI